MVWNRIAQITSIDPLADGRDVRHEDGGLARIAEIKDGKHDRLWVPITSWVEPGGQVAHPEIERMLGKRVRVTIEVEEDQLDPNEQRRLDRTAQVLRDSGIADAALAIATMKPDIRATLIGRCLMEAEDEGVMRGVGWNAELRHGWQALAAMLREPTPEEIARAGFSLKEA